jgi:hypothetical protein
VRKGDDLTTFILPKAKKIRSLNLSEPLGPPRPVAGHLYLLPFKRVCQTVTTGYFNFSILLIAYNVVGPTTDIDMWMGRLSLLSMLYAIFIE